MGRLVSDEQQGLIAIAAFLVIIGFVPFMITDMKPLFVKDWMEAVYQIFLLSFIVLQVWTSTRGKRFGFNHIIVFVFTSGILIALTILLILKDIDSLYLEYDGEHAYSTLEWILVSSLLFIIPVSFSAILLVFGDRDMRFEERMVRLPVSRYAQWKDELSIRVRPEEIMEVYPRWGVTLKKRSGGFFKLPEYGARKKEGFGFRLRDGRRFGYEMTSKMILEKDLVDILGRTRFQELLLDHSQLDEKDLKGLKEDISHWYTNQDAFQVISVLIALGVLTVNGIVLTLLSENISLWVPFLIFSSIILFGWMIIGTGRTFRKWLFIKGTVFRMADNGEKIPDWLDIKGTEFLLRKK